MGRLVDTDDLMKYAFGNRKGLIHTADIDKCPTAMEMLHGTLHITVDHDISNVYRVWLSQKGTHYGELYYPDYTDEEIQKMQNLEQAQLDKAYELGRQSAQPEPSACWACNCPKMQLLEKDTTFGKWVPCSETIDIPDHEVLCCDKYGEELIGWLSYNDDQWLCESDGEIMYDPVAWREKPEPYRGEQE